VSNALYAKVASLKCTRHSMGSHDDDDDDDDDASGGFGVMQWMRVERCMDADR